MRVATYVRVSTRSQDLEPQELRLRELCSDRGWEITAQFSDVASGRRRRQAGRRPATPPGLAALLRAARRREFDAVVVVKLDRLARSTRELCELAEEFEAAEVDLVAADQPVDTTSASGRLLFGVLATVAQFEADLIRERTLDGLRAARRRGARFGRPAALDRGGCDRARRLAAAGRSVREVAEALGVSRATAHRAIRGHR